MTAVVLERTAWDDPDVARLRTQQQAELRERYGDDDIGHLMTGDDIVAMLVLRSGPAGEAVACGALRDAAELGPGTGELKRMFVLPQHRGNGHSRAVLAELERLAHEHGYRRLVLETGPLQPEAIGLYLSAGYAPTENYGEYVGVTDSRCFAKELGAPAAGRPGRATASALVEPRPWRDPEAAALRRRMWDEMIAPVYPEVVARVAADGGYDAMDDRIGAGELATWVALVDRRPVGCLSLCRPGPDQPPGTAELKKLFVDPVARGAGVATALLATADDEARARGLGRLVLHTGVRQPDAVRLYAALGWRPVAPFAPWEHDLLALCFARTL
ncbi:GNAT family N-acetyltransferase [Cellulomonas massiliensis]|uniref:GNAT family N-acetyltransferase n=1 Tax=Cellulomonas massiliensis TaxID=1465811 RepID=UPI0002F58257|nr:GNAT family N-acetyltransferase [Cellulomonas massiliensis]